MTIINKITMDLARRGIERSVDLVQGDRYGRLLQITLLANNVPWQIPNGAVAVIRYQRSDGKGGVYGSLPDGSAAYSISGNVLTVIVTPQVCAVPGRAGMTIALMLGEMEINTFVIHLEVTGNPGIGMGAEEAEEDPNLLERVAVLEAYGSKVLSEIAKNLQVSPLFAYSIDECTDTKKLYVLPDGYIYAYMKAEQAQIIIETREGGYYNKSGAWVSAADATGQRTNLIPVSMGDRFRVTSNAKYQASVIWFDASKNIISTETYGDGTNPETVTVTAPADAAFVRFYSYGYSATHLVVTPLDLIEIETNPGGYYNANGAWVEDSQATGQRTNLISVSEGDQFEVTSAAKYQASVIWFTSAEAKLSHETYGGSGKDPVTTTVTAPSGAAYVRFYSYGYGATYLAVKPLAESEESYAWASTGHAFVPADYEGRIVELEEKVDALGSHIGDGSGNGVDDGQGTIIDDPLYGKKIVYDGDSICYGAGHKGGYAKIIAELTGGSYVNQAVGGGRLVTKGSNSWHSVVDNLPNLPKDGDLYCFEGGINDFWTSGMQLGVVDYTNFTGTLDASTVCGALETIFRYALNTFVGKPVCFVITHKIQETAHRTNTSGNTFKEYHDAMVTICEKYSIPYYDAFNESGLNGWNAVHNANFFTDGDGCHPTEEGYKRYYVPQLLDLFRRIIPQEGATTILYYDAIRRYLDENLTAESWTFELEDGSSVSKDVMVK